MNYSRFLTSVSLAREESAIRKLTGLMALNPVKYTLAGGMPNAALFPFTEANITLRDGTHITLDKEKMEKALQYGPTQGYLPLLEKLKDYQKRLHNPPNWSNSNVIVTVGSQDGLSKAIDMLVEKGDYVLLQEPVYPGTLAAIKPLTENILSVPEDGNGIIPEKLRQVLNSKWSPEEYKTKSKGIPKFLYLIPNGSNPSGTSIPMDRRTEIYEIAREYNLLILEDDPYYFLQFADKFIPSFLSIDTDGRVLRFDSFSKVLSSGMRLGYVTGPSPLIQRINYHMQSSVLHASTLSQVVVNELLQNWGFDGFMNHVDRTRQFYKQQCKYMVESADRWLKDVAEWSVPNAGMFLWMKLKDINDTDKLISEIALGKGVALVPGKAFFFSVNKSAHMRASFSSMPKDQIDKACELLSTIIKEEIKCTGK